MSERTELRETTTNGGGKMRNNLILDLISHKELGRRSDSSVAGCLTVKKTLRGSKKKHL